MRWRGAGPVHHRVRDSVQGGWCIPRALVARHACSRFPQLHGWEPPVDEPPPRGLRMYSPEKGRGVARRQCRPGRQLCGCIRRRSACICCRQRLSPRVGARGAMTAAASASSPEAASCHQPSHRKAGRETTAAVPAIRASTSLREIPIITVLSDRTARVRALHGGPGIRSAVGPVRGRRGDPSARECRWVGTPR